MSERDREGRRPADMSPQAIAARLAAVEELRALALSLGRARRVGPAESRPESAHPTTANSGCSE